MIFTSPLNQTKSQTFNLSTYLCLYVLLLDKKVWNSLLLHRQLTHRRNGDNIQTVLKSIGLTELKLCYPWKKQINNKSLPKSKYRCFCVHLCMYFHLIIMCIQIRASFYVCGLGSRFRVCLCVCLLPLHEH